MIKDTEVGKIYAYATSFDLSAFTELTLKFTSPTSVVTTLTNSGGRVSAPSVPLTTEVEQEDGSLINQTLAADTYMQITTIATDFIESGKYAVCGTYEDVTPKKFFGDEGSLTIEAKC